MNLIDTLYEEVDVEKSDLDLIQKLLRQTYFHTPKGLKFGVMDIREGSTEVDGVKPRLFKIYIYPQTLGVHKEIIQDVMDGVSHQVKEYGITDTNLVISLNDVIMILNENNLMIPIMEFFTLADQNRIKRPRRLIDLMTGEDDYGDISDELPTFSPDFQQDVNLTKKKAENVYKLLKKGTIDGVSYDIPGEPTVNIIQFSHLHNPTEKIIKPHLRPLVFSSSHTLPPEIRTKLIDKFEKFGIKLI
jgi:hypothetical protein